MLTRMDTQHVLIPRLAYSLAEAELATGLSRSSLNRAIARGELRREKVGGRTIIPAAELAALCGASESAK